MSQVIIDNPVINSPFAEPERHFCFTDDGITAEIVTKDQVVLQPVMGTRR